MYFKRNESFRFTFVQPIPGKLFDMNNGEDRLPIIVSLLDVSMFGAKVYCEDNTQLENGAQIKLSYMIQDTLFDAIGTISWIKPSKTSYQMGLQLNTDDTYHDTIVQTLKDLKRMLLD